MPALSHLRLQRSVAGLPPAYFALVMATGIVAIAAHFEGMRWLAMGLTWFNLAAFIVLWLMTIARIVFYRDAFFEDLQDFDRGPGFFTIVAGTAVLGCQLILVFDRPGPAFLLWLLAIPLWAFFMYAILTRFTIRDQKPRLEDGINGGWLVAVVATQGVAELGALLSGRYAPFQQQILFFALSMWLAGGMLYIWLISLIFYRYTFFRFLPSDLMPPYWINMGAMAISTLAGTALIASAPSAPFLTDLLPFLKGFTIFFWATATWWIPMLLILGYWRHVTRKFSFAYSPLYWGGVFPLGMYTVCSYQLSKVLGLPFLLWIPRVSVYVALSAWIATFAGLAHSLFLSTVNQGDRMDDRA